MKPHLISILLPIRNAAKFLPACLESIQNQTENEWELLAINDHSTDVTANILKYYAAKDSRIRVFENEDKGIIAALRLAFKNSSGNLITRMDADDVMAKEKLASLKNLLLEKGKGFVSTGLVQYFSEGELGDGYKKYEQWLNALSLEEKNLEDIYKECVIPSPCWMVWRTDLMRCGAFESNTYPEDYDLCFRFYKNNMKVVAAKKVLHHWRDYSTRTSRTDTTYANQHYFDLKLPYFLELDFDKNRPLVIWGAGTKGKLLTKNLLERKINFHWVSNNEKKNGKNIYGKIVEPFQRINQLPHPQVIVSVAAPEGQIEILNFFKKNNFQKGKDYFFFC